MALASVSPTVAGSKPKNLLDQTRDVLRLKHYSLRTDQMAPVVAFNTLIVSAPFDRGSEGSKLIIDTDSPQQQRWSMRRHQRSVLRKTFRTVDSKLFSERACPVRFCCW